MKGSYPLVYLHSWLEYPPFLLLGEYLVGNTCSINPGPFSIAILDYRSVSSNFWSSQDAHCMVYLPTKNGGSFGGNIW